MDLKNKMITLNNDEKYIVVDIMNYANRQFLLMDKVINNEELEENFVITELKDNHINIINDESIIDELKSLFINKNND